MKTNAVVYCLLSILLLVFAASVGAEKNGEASGVTEEDIFFMEVPLVVAASRMEQPASRAPSSISVVTKDEIRKFGYRTLADILRSQRGFQIAGDRNYTYLSVRGFGRTGDYNSRFLLLVDGHRVNDNIYSSASIGNDFILDVDLIERIEIVRGPGSSLYGNNAFFAVINIITREALDVDGVEMSGEAGSYDTFRGRASIGLPGEQASGVFSASLFDADGRRRLYYREFDSPALNHGVAQNCDKERNYGLFGNMDYRDFTMEAAYVSRTKTIPTASYGADFNDSRNRTTDERGYAYIKYEHPNWNSIGVMSRLFYDLYEYRGTYVYDGVVQADGSEGRSVGAEVLFMKSVVETHKVSVGAEYQRNFHQSQKNYDRQPYRLNLDDKRDSEVWAVYFQDEFTITDDLILNAGVRYDHYTTFGGTTNPRCAFIYSPFESTVVKVVYGEAFRAPNVYELYYGDGFWSMANTRLYPERIKTLEGIVEQRLNPYFKLTVTAFYNRIDDLIMQEEDEESGMLVFRNTENAEAKGAEFELEGASENGVRGRLSYTYQRAVDLERHTRLVNSPEHLVKLNLVFPLSGDKIFGGVEQQITSRRKTLKGDWTDSYSLTNVTIYGAAIFRGLDFSVSVYDLFDEKPEDPGAEEHEQDLIEQDGRSFRVKLTYRF